MLAGTLTENEGALRASFQTEYGLRLLPGGRTDPYRDPVELGDLLEQLPGGTALGRAIGGAAALSEETLMLREVIYRLEVLDWRETGQKSAAPKRIELPPAPHEERAEAEAMSVKAAAWQARQARRQESSG